MSLFSTLFCREVPPDRFSPPIFASPLSERWHRVAIQQASGTAQSWHSNREQAYQNYLEALEEYEEQQKHATLDAQASAPAWR